MTKNTEGTIPVNRELLDRIHLFIATYWEAKSTDACNWEAGEIRKLVERTYEENGDEFLIYEVPLKRIVTQEQMKIFKAKSAKDAAEQAAKSEELRPHKWSNDTVKETSGVLIDSTNVKLYNGTGKGW